MTAPVIRCPRHYSRQRLYYLAGCDGCRAAQSATIPQPRPTPEDTPR